MFSLSVSTDRNSELVTMCTKPSADLPVATGSRLESRLLDLFVVLPIAKTIYADLDELRVRSPVYLCLWVLATS